MESRSFLNVYGSCISRKFGPCPQNTSSPKDRFNKTHPLETHCRFFLLVSTDTRENNQPEVRGVCKAQPLHGVHPPVMDKALSSKDQSLSG